MKLSIIFVDDEENVIQGLKRMMRPLRTDWEFYFATSGKEALEILATTEMDVIVSDMRMPEMNGAELLSKVKELYPSIIRIILSGQSNEEIALKSTLTVHQFIAKPVEAEDLKEKIRKSYKLYSILDNAKIRKVINGIDKLPSMPETYLKIEEELRKENFSLRTIAKIINADVVMSAKVLQIVNSAFFGLATSVTNVTQAVNLLGADTIKSLVLLVQVFKGFKGDEKIRMMLSNVYEHSLKVAKSARQIMAKYSNDKKAQDEAYLAGLLHDIGKIVILSTTKFRNDILSRMEDEDIDYKEAEEKVLNTTHAEIGGYLISLWGLPQVVVEAVLFHHKVDEIEVESGSVSVLAALHIANSISSCLELDTEFFEKLGIDTSIVNLVEICNN